jgi:capsular polysaccharide biosynthesis protein
MKDFDEVEEKGQLDARAWLTLIWSRKGLLFLIAVAGGAVAAGIALLVPNTYTANALILPPAKPQSLSTAMIGQLGGMAALAPALGLKDPGDMYIGIMKSRSVIDELVSRFHLQQVYHASTKDAARGKLLARASFVSGRDSMIRISVEDREPRRAAELSNAFITELNAQNSRLAITESAQRRLFYEHEVDAEKAALTGAETAMRETQLRTGVVETSGQAQVVIASIAQLRGGIAMREVELERLRTGATLQNPEVVRQKAELTSMRNELAGLETGSGSRQQTGDPLVPVVDVPKAGLDYLRALRDVKYHEALFEMLFKQYEAARIDEAKEAPVIQVVDYAIPPESKSGPPRSAITMLGTIVAGIAGIVYVRLKAGPHFAGPAPAAG